MPISVLRFTLLTWTLVLTVSVLVSCIQAAPSGPTATPHPFKGYTNITALLEERTHNLERRAGIIGTGICQTAMQGFSCDMSNHEQNRCAGDNYSYCICAGGANGAGVPGLWLNTAWGPGCEACYGKNEGYIFDGTCHGDGTGGYGQDISEIMATMTITITVIAYSGAQAGGHIRRYL